MEALRYYSSVISPFSLASRESDPPGKTKAYKYHGIRKQLLHTYYSLKAKWLPVIFICVVSCDFKSLIHSSCLLTHRKTQPSLLKPCRLHGLPVSFHSPIILTIYLKLVSEPNPRSAPAPMRKFKTTSSWWLGQRLSSSGLSLFFPSFHWLHLNRDSQDKVEMDRIQVFSGGPGAIVLSEHN